PTTLEPYSTISLVWKEPLSPVMPWTMIGVFSSIRMLIGLLPARAYAVALVGSCAALQASTALLAASAKVSAVISSSPLSARILRPSSTLVPASRTTSGTFTSTVWQACTTPLATQSQRLMPAKKLTSTALTLASDTT